MYLAHSTNQVSFMAYTQHFIQTKREDNRYGYVWMDVKIVEKVVDIVNI